jgi:hypothetical protein
VNVRSLKLAGAAAGLLFLVGAAPSVHAQSTQVLSMNNFNQTTKGSASSQTHSKFTFLGSLILTEVGFATKADVTPRFSYKINSGELIPVTVSSTITDSYGVAWHTLLNPVQMNNGDIVSLLTYDGGTSGAAMSQNGFTSWTSSNSLVRFDGFRTSFASSSPFMGLSTGNLRVSPSNPSANVAPEPGSIALLLTGGGALAGIALRRRRNAA